MKRAPLVLLFAVTAAFMLSSCKDEQSPTTPIEVVSPQFGLTPTSIEGLVGDLIEDMFPGRQLRRAADQRWANIQRMFRQDKREEAKIQAMEMAAWLPVRLSEDQLADPNVSCAPLLVEFCGMLYPEETEPWLLTLTTDEEGVSLFSYLLFQYVGLSGDDEFPVLPLEIFDAPDWGYGVLKPGVETVILTENGWAAVAGGTEATGEPVLVTLALTSADLCNFTSDLQRSYGCWDINRYPDGDFDEPVVVETCVSHNEDAMTDEEYLYDQLLHSRDDDGTITAHPWSEPQYVTDEDCQAGFPEGGEGGGEGMAAMDEDSSIWSSLKHRFTGFLFPEPLNASPSYWWRVPPRALGGLPGSFTEFFGAVADYATAPEGTGTYDTWSVDEPSDPVSLCDWSTGPCAEPAVNDMAVSATATMSSSIDPYVWSRVMFFYHVQGSVDPPVLIEEVDPGQFDHTDNGVTRFYTWTISLDGFELPAGDLEIFAVGVENDGDMFATPLNTNATVVAGGGVADLWTITAPLDETEICDDAAVGTCPLGTVNSVAVSARAAVNYDPIEGPVPPSPFTSVEFFYRIGTGPATSFDADPVLAATDPAYGIRYFTWTGTLSAVGITEGDLKVWAEGDDGTSLYVTPVNTQITALPPGGLISGILLGPDAVELTADVQLDGPVSMLLTGVPGAFAFPGLPAGDYTVSASIIDYEMPAGFEIGLSETTTVASAADEIAVDFLAVELVPVAVGPGTAAWPRIDGDRVVWQDDRYGYWDVFLLDGLDSTTPVEQRITDEPAIQAFPDIWGDWIVWTDERAGPSLSDIYAYNLSTATEYPVETAPLDQWLPVIDNGWIAWEGKRGQDPSTGYDIYLTHVGDAEDWPGGSQPLIDDVTTQTDAAIHGDEIVFTDTRAEPHPPPSVGNYDIYSRNLSVAGFPETQITSDPGMQRYPDVYAGKIVWQDHRNGLSDVYLFDGSEIRITDEPQSQGWPAIYGDKIVWQDQRNGNWDIFMYDIVTGVETQLTSHPSDQNTPVIYGGWVVWVDGRNGTADIYAIQIM